MVNLLLFLIALVVACSASTFRVWDMWCWLHLFIFPCGSSSNSSKQSISLNFFRQQNSAIKITGAIYGKQFNSIKQTSLLFLFCFLLYETVSNVFIVIFWISSCTVLKVSNIFPKEQFLLMSKYFFSVSLKILINNFEPILLFI